MELAVLVLLAAIAPPAAWTWFFWTRDRYEREPRSLIVTLFAVGALVAVPMALIVNELAGAVIGIGLVTILAGVTEEPIKLWVTAWRTRRNPNLNEPVDGLIYGTAVGLGFAAAETVLYLIQGLFGEQAQLALALGIDPFVNTFAVTAPIRGLLTALMHGFCTGIAGYVMGRLVLTGTFGWSRMVAPLAGVALLHGIFNFAASTEIGLPGIIAVTVLIGAIWTSLLRRALAASPHRPADPARPLAAVVAAVAPASTAVCSSCGAAVPAGAKFCPACATPVATATTGSRRCSSCGAEAPATARHCPSCGVSLA